MELGSEGLNKRFPGVEGPRDANSIEPRALPVEEDAALREAGKAGDRGFEPCECDDDGDFPRPMACFL